MYENEIMYTCCYWKGKNSLYCQQIWAIFQSPKSYVISVYIFKRFQLTSQDGFNSPQAKWFQFTSHCFQSSCTSDQGLDFQTKTRHHIWERIKIILIQLTLKHPILLLSNCMYLWTKFQIFKLKLESINEIKILLKNQLFIKLWW